MMSPPLFAVSSMPMSAAERQRCQIDLQKQMADMSAGSVFVAPHGIDMYQLVDGR